MPVIVEIQPGVMQWVLHRVNVDRLSTNTRENLVLWNRGAKKPTFNQIERLSREANIPLGYFFLKTPPIEDVPLLKFRTINSSDLENASRNLIDTINQMESVQDWMRDYLTAADNSNLSFVGSLKNNNDALNIAQAIRRDLELPYNWYSEVRTAYDAFKLIRILANTAGVLVMLNGIVGSNTRRKLDINEFRAFTLIDKYAPLIFINSNDSDGGKLFSIFHEMAHIWIGVNSLFNDRYGTAKNVKKVETLCNAVAGELLIPADMFIKKWNELPSDLETHEKIISLVKIFHCGITIIARKALDNSFISQEDYNSIAREAITHFEVMQKKKREKESGGNYYKAMNSRLDHRFLLTIANSVREGKTLYTDAFRLTNTTRNTFSELVQKARGDAR